MTRETSDWKHGWIEAVEDSVAFFSREHKFEREKWVVARLLEVLLDNFEENSLAPSEEPGDVRFGYAMFQVKELLESGRRRGEEYRSHLKRAYEAERPEDLMEQYSPQDISLTQIFETCIEYSRDLTTKYGPRERRDLDLIIYHNFTSHNEIPPFSISDAQQEFRSLSVISNGYRSVLYASKTAPIFLQESVGKIWDLEGNVVENAL